MGQFRVWDNVFVILYIFTYTFKLRNLKEYKMRHFQMQFSSVNESSNKNKGLVKYKSKSLKSDL